MNDKTEILTGVLMNIEVDQYYMTMTIYDAKSDSYDGRLPLLIKLKIISKHKMFKAHAITAVTNIGTMISIKVTNISEDDGFFNYRFEDFVTLADT